MINDQLHKQLVREYLEEVDDVLADFDVTLGNLSAGSADTTAEGKRLCDYLEDLTQSTSTVLEDL